MKIKGLKKAVGEYKRWVNSGYGRIADIMMDTSDGTIWCDAFLSSNSWKVYHSEDIISLTAIMANYEIYDITQDSVKKALICAMEDGIIPYYEINYKTKK